MKEVFFPILVLFVLSCSPKETKNDLYNNPPFPIGTVSIFARDLISTHLNEYNITFSPDENTILFTIANNTSANRFYTIFITEKKNGIWTKPQIAPFSGQFSDADPFFDPSGKRIYFISTRPTIARSVKSDFDIWYVDYDNKNFGLAQHLGNEVNSFNDELYPAVSEKGNLFYSTENGKNGYDLVVSKYVDNRFQRPVILGDSINTSKTEFDAYVAPDESYIIYTGIGYIDSQGSGDLYISFNKGTHWTKGKNLGNKINSVNMEQCPMVSLSGRFLFFTSFRDSQSHNSDYPMRTEEYLNKLNSPLNGLGDVFWTDMTNFLNK